MLEPKGRAVLCQRLGTTDQLTLRVAKTKNMVPGEILTVNANKQWHYARRPYLSGTVEKTRLEITALGLTPLLLNDEYSWDPAQHYWGDDGVVDPWQKAIIQRGHRNAYVMEQVVPGRTPNNWESDPMMRAIDLSHAGDIRGAQQLLVATLALDLRCLGAHSHLGYLRFDKQPSCSLRHYEVGVRIGKLSLGSGFDGLLPWGHIDNRPFLRCMHGYALCLWRLERQREAEAIFERMLWLNPGDNQGIRFMLPKLQAGVSWEVFDAEV